MAPHEYICGLFPEILLLYIFLLRKLSNNPPWSDQPRLKMPLFLSTKFHEADNHLQKHGAKGIFLCHKY